MMELEKAILRYLAIQQSFSKSCNVNEKKQLLEFLGRCPDCGQNGIKFLPGCPSIDALSVVTNPLKYSRIWTLVLFGTGRDIVVL